MTNAWWSQSAGVGLPNLVCAQCRHHNSPGEYGELVDAPGPIPNVETQYMKVVTSVDMFSRSIAETTGKLIEPGSRVALLPGAVLVHWYYPVGQHFAVTGVVWQLGEDGRWPTHPIARHAGTTWFQELRAPVARALALAPSCMVCPPDGDELTPEETPETGVEPESEPA